MKLRGDLSGLARLLIVHAAHQAPAVLAQRLEEEWLADFEYRSGQISRLRLAIGCWWATAVIARDFGVSRLATSTAPAAHKILLRGVANVLPRLSYRTVMFAVQAGMCVLVLAYLSLFQDGNSVPTPIHTSPLVETSFHSRPWRCIAWRSR